MGVAGNLGECASAKRGRAISGRIYASRESGEESLRMRAKLQRSQVRSEQEGVDSGERGRLVHTIPHMIKEFEKNQSSRKENEKMELETSESCVKNCIIKEVNLNIILCFTVGSSYQARRANPCSTRDLR